MNQPAGIVYTQIPPHEALSPFIDAFWTVTGDNSTPVPDKILPDGCVDIILNTGPGFIADQGGASLDRGQAYLLGTMTHYKEMLRPPRTRLIGIRFKPGGFSFFYPPAFLKDTADKVVEFDPRLLPVIDEEPRTLQALLNRFFYDRLTTPPQEILPLITAIHQAKGRITVSELAKRNFITIRQLERFFNLHLAIGPKEYINFTRYQAALAGIRHDHSRKSLLDIAFECGYYDHAHLSNEKVYRIDPFRPVNPSLPLILTPPSP
jgi:AraC-like DNA-binding protein